MENEISKECLEFNPLDKFIKDYEKNGFYISYIGCIDEIDVRDWLDKNKQMVLDYLGRK